MGIIPLKNGVFCPLPIGLFSGVDAMVLGNCLRGICGRWYLNCSHSVAKLKFSIRGKRYCFPGIGMHKCIKRLSYVQLHIHRGFGDYSSFMYIDIKIFFIVIFFVIECLSYF